jgi:L-alanine-DL-glutamate epimerase-like enolase superfamily enzyme
VEVEVLILKKQNLVEMIHFSYKPYDLRLKHVLRIAQGERKGAPLVLTQLEFDGVKGYGEGCLPALYGESLATAQQFYAQLDLSPFSDPFETESILSYVDRIAPGNQAAKTAIDIALHDLVGKLAGRPVHQLFGLPACPQPTSMTIGIDKPHMMAERALGYKDFKYLKIKLGATDDRAIIRAIREVSEQPLFIDANQGWSDREEALDMIHWLKEQGTVFIEQPMHKHDWDGNAWLSERSPLPLVADEAFQRLSDLKQVADAYSGINIKLMKSTGLREGFKMAVAAKALGLKVMLGCMTETSCASSAGAQLMALADWVDLDGNLDVTNDPYVGARVEDGFLIPSEGAGLGLCEPDWDSL